MPLDPQAAALLKMMKRMGLPLMRHLPIEEARKSMEELAMMSAPRPAGLVREALLPGPATDIPVRIYNPAAGGNKLYPVLVYFHGGGFCMGGLNSHDALCRDFCMDVGVTVVSVAYRLAPEHKFPAATDDCLAATCWIGANISRFAGDPRRIAVAGDSAGGNLAAVTALRARDEAGPALSGQLLLYPTIGDQRDVLPSHHAFHDNESFITLDDIEWSRHHYLRDDADAANPLASPLAAPDLRGLPPALVITAEVDVLRDDGERYAARLREAGVPTVLTRYEGMMHAFLQMNVFDQTKQAMEQICRWLQQRLG